IRQIRECGLWDRVTMIQGFSHEVGASWSGPKVGLLFIDGDHHQHAVRKDFASWARHLSGDAVIASDDYSQSAPGVPAVADAQVKLSASIMAHRKRQAEAEELQASLDRDVPIVYDPEPEPSKDPAQRWITGRMAWEAHDPGADYHLVIQDDALACADLISGLEKALDVLGPKGLVCAYSGTGKPHQAHIKRAIAHATDKGHSWWCS